jgi:cyclic-di-GMP phosphodiesterase TipF (flagellum assembly factor)
MARIAAIFVSVCMLLIASAVGAVLYLQFGLSGAESTMVALAALTGLALYHTVSTRVRDRGHVGDQIADLSRGTADLGRQGAEFGRQLAALESKFETLEGKTRAATDSLALEIGELGNLVKQLAESVAAYDSAVVGGQLGPSTNPHPSVIEQSQPTEPKPAHGEAPAPEIKTEGEAVQPGQQRETMIALIRGAIEANRVDLYLQPVVTLPQRKVRYYEAMSRLRANDGDVVAAADFLDCAEKAGLMPRIDNLLLFRCVQVLRRLLLKNRDIGLFCNISPATLIDAEIFPQFLDFVDANRVLGPSLVFEFTQHAFRTIGPIEHEALAALADRGFRFSMDHVTDLHMEPRDLAERGIRFVKAPAALLLNRAGSAGDIHAADLSDLLGRFGIDLIAERIESEGVVVDLLDYDVRYGQGFLFSPPRPVRAEALQGIAERGDLIVREGRENLPPEPPPAGNVAPSAPAGQRGAFAQLAGSMNRI